MMHLKSRDKEWTLHVPIWVQMLLFFVVSGFLYLLIMVAVTAVRTYQYSQEIMGQRLANYAAMSALETEDISNSFLSNARNLASSRDVVIYLRSLMSNNATQSSQDLMKSQISTWAESFSDVEAILVYSANNETSTVYALGKSTEEVTVQRLLRSVGSLLPLSDGDSSDLENFLDELTRKGVLLSGPRPVVPDSVVSPYSLSITVPVTTYNENGTLSNTTSISGGDNSILSVGYITVVLSAARLYPSTDAAMYSPDKANVYLIRSLDDGWTFFIPPGNNTQLSDVYDDSVFPAIKVAERLKQSENKSTSSSQSSTSTISLATATSSAGAANAIYQNISTGKPRNRNSIMSTVAPGCKQASIGFSYASVVGDVVYTFVVMRHSDANHEASHLRKIVIGVAAGIFGGLLLIVIPLTRWHTRTLYLIYDGMQLRPSGSSSTESSDSDGGKSLMLDTSEGSIPARLKELKRPWRDELDELVDGYNNMVDRLNQYYYSLEDEVRKRTAEAQEAMLVAEAANLAKSKFIANITHELRTPLNGIMGMTSVSVEEKDLSRIKASLHTIIESGKVLMELLNELLAFSKTQIDFDPVLKEFTAEELLDSLGNMFETRAGAKAISFTMGCIPPSVADIKLKGDIQRATQASLKFLSNAMKFSDHGSVSVLVYLRPRIDPYVSLEPYKRSGQMLENPIAMLEVAVTDTGSGISRAQLSRIFDVFVQGDDSLSKRYRGTGLGMSMSKQLAEAIGGYVGVYSAEGVGTTVILRFPVQCIGQSAFNLAALDGPPISFAAREVWSTISPKAGRVFRIERSKARSKPPVLGNVNGTQARCLQVAHSNAPTSYTPPPFSTSNSKNSSRTSLTVEKEKDTASLNAAHGRSQSDISGTNNSLRVHEATRVLVADDNALNRQILIRMLRQVNVKHIDTAATGAQVIKLVEKSIIDGRYYAVIFMDLQMPDTNGIEATQVIRGTLGYPYPIVALTGFSDAETLELCHKVSIQEVLSKPVMKEHVMRIVARYVYV